MVKSKFPIGTKVLATAKSLHSGQTGVVVGDYVNMLLVKVDDESYTNASSNSVGEGKYFQLDIRAAKRIPK